MIHKKTLEKIKDIENFLKKHAKKESINISKIMNQFNITSSETMTRILDILGEEGKVLVGRYENIIGDKVVTQSVEVKWVGGR